VSERIADSELCEQAWQRGRDTWSTVDSDRATFQRLGEQCLDRKRASGASSPGWDQLNAADLYIVAAVLTQKRGASEAFGKAFLVANRGALARLGLSDAAIDDALQIVRERMLVPSEGTAARITSQVGDGELAALMRVVVIRTGMNLKRTDHRLSLEDEGVFEHLIAAQNPQTELLAAEARTLLRTSLSAAINTLNERDKTLLRLHLFHKMSIDDLGRMYDVHRATAARWLGKIHAQLDLATREQLAKALATSTDHLDSVLAIARSGLSSGFSNVWAELGISRSHQ
jgi:RNA polymerase sigma-70 factor, ECF subfamily